VGSQCSPGSRQPDATGLAKQLDRFDHPPVRQALTHLFRQMFRHRLKGFGQGPPRSLDDFECEAIRTASAALFFLRSLK
jgi:hypothetical protein